MRIRTSSPTLLALLAALPVAGTAQDPPPHDSTPTLGLEGGITNYELSSIGLQLVRASQTVAGLRPQEDLNFDFTPSGRLSARAADGFFHLGDLNLRVRRSGATEWLDASTAAARAPVLPLPNSGGAFASADLAPTLPADLPLRVVRSWALEDEILRLRFELTNTSAVPVEIGALGIPMIFDNILTDRSLGEAHAAASFHDPYIGMDAGYLQVTRLKGEGSALLVVPDGDTPFEAWRPLLSDPTPRGITFEGFHEWMAHSRAYAEDEWRDAEPWNPPTSATLAPGESRTYGVAFLVAPSIRQIEATLAAHGRPVAVGVPGYVLPKDVEGRLFLEYGEAVRSIEVEPAGAIDVTEAGGTPGGQRAFDVRGRSWGRARLTVTYEDGREQTVHYMVIEPAADVADALGRFLTTEQWFERPGDPFGRSPSVISYDFDERRQVTEDDRAWIAGLGDEGGSGSWLAAFMKQLVRPDAGEVRKMERFVDGVLWGRLQVAEGPLAYGVRKSLFYWEPDSLPAGTYSPDVDYGGWASWSREHAMTVGRSYDYPHVAAAHWVMYRLARNRDGLVTNHPWDWYLERAWRTGIAMVEHAPRYAQFGQMDGTAFLLVLQDLQREGWTEEAAELETAMRARADVWRALGYPYGSEMPWDSTGQEEVYAWCRYFGYDDKAAVTLNAILGYMPTLPHWGYNGSARRYWDFLYAGKLRRLERQLHHYGSGLNAIPVLTEYRDHPIDLYLLRVGYGGVLGAIANVTREGFGPSAFHAFPGTLRIDGYSGDYGMGFFGHAVNTGTYVHRDARLGWLAFGGNLREDGPTVRVVPTDASRARVHLAPAGLWLSLDAGTFEEVALADDGTVTLTFAPADAATPAARLRVEQTAVTRDLGRYAPEPSLPVERGAWVVRLGPEPTMVTLQPAG